MNHSISVNARFSHLPDLLACLAGHVTDKELLQRTSLAIEELFANTINHGYGGESDAPVWLTVDATDDLVRITYADAGPEFDPFHDLDKFSHDTDKSVVDRPIGGLGRLLIRHFAGHCQYHRDNGRNVVTLDYPCPSSAA